MLSQVLDAALVASEAAHVELPIPAWTIGAGIMAFFVLLMFATIAFTSVGQRHSAVEEQADPHRQHPNKHDHGQAARH
jgi:protein-S-isoprenylcysteine O-methyltransferase Ste14